MLTEEHSTGPVAEVARFWEAAGRTGKRSCGGGRRVTGRLVLGPADLDFMWIQWRLLRLTWSQIRSTVAKSEWDPAGSRKVANGGWWWRYRGREWAVLIRIFLLASPLSLYLWPDSRD